jgi:hypothetical protein
MIPLAEPFHGRSHLVTYVGQVQTVNLDEATEPAQVAPESQMEIYLIEFFFKTAR